MEQWFCALLLFLCTSLFVFLYYHRESLLYMPASILGGHRLPSDNIPLYRSPTERSLPTEDLYVSTKDGTKLHMWLIRAPTQAPILLYLSGNVGNTGLRLDFIEAIYRELKCHVAVLSYRGYGYSQGKPSEAGLKGDMKDVLDYLTQLPGLHLKGVFLYGEQLGAAVAISAAIQSPSLSGLILENPFLSAKEVLRGFFPYLSWMLCLYNGYWDNTVNISKVRVPVFFLVGEMDETVPRTHSLTLQKLLSVPYEELSVPTGDNLSTWSQAGPALWPALSSFLSKYSH